MADSQIDLNSIQKGINYSKLILLQSLYYLEQSTFLTRFVYFMIDNLSLLPFSLTRNYFLSQSVNEVIHFIYCIPYKMSSTICH